MKKIEEQIRKAIEDLPFLELKEKLETTEDTFNVKVSWQPGQVEELKESFNIDLELIVEKTLSEQVLLKATEKLFAPRDSMQLTTLLKSFAIVSPRIAALLQPNLVHTKKDSIDTRFDFLGIYEGTSIFLDPTITYEQTHVRTFDEMPLLQFTLEVEKTDTSMETRSNYFMTGTEKLEIYNFPEHMLDKK